MTGTSSIGGREAALRRVVLVGAAAALGLLAARALWLAADGLGLVSEPRPLMLAAGAAASAAASAGRGQPGHAALLQGPNLFAPPDASAADLPATDLNLALLGVRASSTQAAASAVIRTPDNRSGIYQTGDQILPGVILEAVHADRVVLGKAGARESLRLRGRESGLLTLITAPEDRASAASAGLATSGATGRLTLQIADLAAFVAASGLRPDSEAGLDGFRVDPVNPAALSGTGFAPGDLIISLGNSPAPQADLEALAERLAGGEAVSAVLWRQGARLDAVLSAGPQLGDNP